MPKTSIAWTEFTWKVFEGCLNDCLNNEGNPYCYTHRFMKDRTPKFYPERLDEPLKRKKPTMWFVANTGDMWKFARRVYIRKVIEIIKQCPQHTFQFLTKFPFRYLGFDPFPDNVWVGISVTRQEDIHRIGTLQLVKAKVRFISFEPLLENIDLSFDMSGIHWAIVGAETDKNSYTPKNEEESKGYAEFLLPQLKKLKIPIFIKPNLRWKENLKQYPERTK